MATLYTLVLSVNGLFTVATGFRLIALGVGMALGGAENKPQYVQRIKNTLIVFVISLLVGGTGGVIRSVLTQYFQS